MKNKIVTEYIKEVSDALTCSKKMKKLFMKELESDVTDYVGDKVITDKEALYSHFGYPNEIESSFFDKEIWTRSLIRAKRRSKIAKILIVVIIILCVVAIFFMIMIYRRYSGGYDPALSIEEQMEFRFVFD